MTKHTPGPWRVSERRGFGSDVWREITPRVVEAAGYEVSIGGEYAGFECGVKISEADARLIAAAPDMYEALMEIVRHVHEEPVSEAHISEIARAALARARGEEVTA